jgi:hypothetical protein
VEVLLKTLNETFFLSFKKNGTNNSLNFEKSELVQCFFFWGHFLIINLKEFNQKLAKISQIYTRKTKFSQFLCQKMVKFARKKKGKELALYKFK